MDANMTKDVPAAVEDANARFPAHSYNAEQRASSPWRRGSPGPVTSQEPVTSGLAPGHLTAPNFVDAPACRPGGTPLITQETHSKQGGTQWGTVNDGYVPVSIVQGYTDRGESQHTFVPYSEETGSDPILKELKCASGHAYIKPISKNDSIPSGMHVKPEYVGYTKNQENRREEADWLVHKSSHSQAHSCTPINLSDVLDALNIKSCVQVHSDTHFPSTISRLAMIPITTCRPAYCLSLLQSYVAKHTSFDSVKVPGDKSVGSFSGPGSPCYSRLLGGIQV